MGSGVTFGLAVGVGEGVISVIISVGVGETTAEPVGEELGSSEPVGDVFGSRLPVGEVLGSRLPVGEVPGPRLPVGVAVGVGATELGTILKEAFVIFNSVMASGSPMVKMTFALILPSRSSGNRSFVGEYSTRYVTEASIGALWVIKSVTLPPLPAR